MVSFLLLVYICTLFLAACGEFISTDYEGYNEGRLGHRPHHEFYSSTERSPVLQVTTFNETAMATGGSHIFLRNDGLNASDLASPLILDAHDLTAVYMNRSFANVFGTRVQENLGKKYLTFWEGEKPSSGIGDGYGLAFDENYHLRYRVSAQNLHRMHSDLHEFAFTGNGTALVTGVYRVKVRTAGWRGWKGPRTYDILDAVFQEIDLETNEVLFDWRASEHIDPMDSYEPIHKDWDTYHMNSIQKTQAGNFLISIRHTQSIYLISGTTGEVLWTLGGKRNMFVEPTPPAPGTAPVLSFAWQHHARFVPHTNETQMTLFDNHAEVTSHGACTAGSCSRGLHVALDITEDPPTVQFLAEYHHPSRLQAQSQGSLQPLEVDKATGEFERVFIGWGRCPSFTEHDAATGQTLLDVQFSPWHSEAIEDALDNYRAYRMDWKAEPWWDPVIALREGDVDGAEGTLDVYVSWNGATEVRGWAVRGLLNKSSAGDEIDAPLLAIGERTGFETRLMNVSRAGLTFLWAEALDAEGAVIRKTDVVDLVGGNVTIFPFADNDFEELLEAKEEAGSSWRWLVLGGVVFGLGLVTMGGRMLWQRYDRYDRLEADDLDLDGESDEDEDMPLGMGHFFMEGETPEPWQDYSPRIGLRDRPS